MAIDKSKMVVEIEAKFTEGSKAFENALKNIDNIVKETEKSSTKTQIALEKIQAQYENLAKSIKDSPDFSKNLKNASDQAKETNKNLKNLSESIDIASIQNENLSKTYKHAFATLKRTNTEYEKLTNNVSQSTDAFDEARNKTNQFLTNMGNIGSIISGVIDSFTFLNNVVSNIFNPNTLESLKNILQILGAIAQLKGFDRLSDAMVNASEKVNQLNDNIISLRENSDDNFNEMAQSAELYNNKLLIVPFTFKKIFSGLKSGINAFNNMKFSLAELKHGLDLITSSDTVERLSIILKILALFARVKGFDHISDSLRQASENINDFATKFNDNVDGVFGDIEKLEDKINLVNAALATFESTILATKGATGAFVTVGLVNSFLNIKTAAKEADLSILQFSKNIPKTAEATAKGFHEAFFTVKNTIQSMPKDVTNLFSILKRIATPGLVGIIESGSIASTALLGLGASALKSESSLMKLLGTISILTGVLIGGFGAAILIAIRHTGKLIESIGDKLLNAMTKMEEKFQKANITLKQFGLVINGFSQKLGSKFVGTIDQWTSVINEFEKSTTYSRNEIIKSISFLIKESEVLGFDFSQNINLISAAVDIAAVSQKDLLETTVALGKGLSGNVAAIQSYGIDLSEATVSQTDFAKSQEKTFSEMTAYQKNIVRLDKVLNFHKKVLGSSAIELDTVTGSTKQLDKSIVSLQEKLGSQSAFTVIFISSINQILSIFTKMPDFIFKIIGNLLDFGGVFLKISGIILQVLLKISLLITGYKILSAVTSENSMVQKFLTTSMSLLGKVLGIQTLQVTNLSIAWSNISLIFKSIVTKTFETLSYVLVNATQSITQMTAAILSNPIFIKSVVITSTLAVIISLLQEFDKEIMSLINDIPYSVKVITALAIAVKTFSYAMSIAIVRNLIFIKTVREIIAISVITAAAITGTTNGFLFMAVASKTAAIVLLTKLKTALIAITIAMKSFTLSIITNPFFIAGTVIAALIASIAVAASDLKAEIKSLSPNIEENNNKTKEYVEQISTWRLIFLAIKDTIIGVLIAIKEFIKIGMLSLIASFNYARIAWNKFISMFQKGDELKQTKKDISNIKKETQLLSGVFTRSFVRMFDAITKTNIALAETGTTIKNTDKSFKEFDRRAELLSNIKIDIFGDEFEKALANFERTIPAYRKGFEKIKQGIYLTGEELKDFQNAEEEYAKSFLQIQKLREDTILSLKDQQNIIHLDSLKNSGKLVEATKLENQAQLESINKRIEGLKKIDGLTSDQIKTIEKTRNILVKAGKEAIEAARQEELKKKFGDLIQQYNDLIKSTKDLEKANAMAGKSQLEAIEAGKKAQLKEIDLLEKRLKLIGKLEGKEKDLSKSRKAIEEAAIEQKKAAKVDMSGQIGQVGGNVAKMASDMGSLIGGSMGTALESFASSIMTMISSTASAIIGMILAIPSLIDSIAGLIDSITSFPLDLRDSLRNLYRSITQFITDFIPNILDALGDIVLDLATFLAEGIPEAIDKLIAKLPEAFVGLFDKMPEIAEKFAIAFIKLDPTVLALKLTVAIIKMMPRIIKSFLKAIPLIIQGIIDGLRSALMDLPNYIFGDGDKIAEKASNSFKKLASSITGQTSQLFKVADLENIKKQGESADRFAQSFEDGARKAVNILEKWWSEIEKAWKELWNWIKEKIITPFTNALKSIWNWINEKIITPLVTTLEKIFNFLLEKIVNPLLNGLETIFNFLLDTIVNPLLSGLQKIFTFIHSNIIVPLSNLINSFMSIGSQSLELFKDMGKTIFKGLKEGLETLPKFFTDLFDNLNPANLIQKIFKVDYKGTGTVEKALGIDIPFMNFAKGGKVPGQAAISGDSILNDKVLAFLSPGEAIIPRSIMNDPKMANLIDAILNNKMGIPQFAFGGTLGKLASGDVSGAASDIGGGVTKAVSDVVSPLTDKLWSQVKDAVFNEMILNMLKANKFQHGGLVTGVGGVVEPGEFVMSKPSVQNLGVDFLGSLNNRNNRSTDNVKQDFTFNIKIETKDKLDESFIRNRLMPSIKEQLRRDSLDGKRLIAATGIG